MHTRNELLNSKSQKILCNGERSYVRTICCNERNFFNFLYIYSNSNQIKQVLNFRDNMSTTNSEKNINFGTMPLNIETTNKHIYVTLNPALYDDVARLRRRP